MDAPDETRQFARMLRGRMSLPEVLLWRSLRGARLGLRFRRQHPIGPYVLDFYCDSARLCAEVDGDGHRVRGRKDADRDAWLAGRGIRTVRIPAKAVLRDPDAAARWIAAHARGEDPDAPLPGALSRG